MSVQSLGQGIIKFRTLSAQCFDNLWPYACEQCVCMHVGTCVWVCDCVNKKGLANAIATP